MLKILKANLLIMVMLTLIFIAFDWSMQGMHGLLVGMLSLLLIAFMVIINFILGVIGAIRKNGQAKYYFLNTLLVLLIGIPLCFGGAFVSSLKK